MSHALTILTIVHTALSLVAIVAGFVVMMGLLKNRGRQLWTFGFLAISVLNVLTGFLFPFHGMTPAFIFGVLSVFPITMAYVARYRHRLVGPWRGIYVVSAMTAFYLNFFILVVMAFQKIPALTALAPTQKEPPIVIAQAAAFLFFLVATILAVKKFRPINELILPKF
jgi:hypothetical protein